MSTLPDAPFDALSAALPAVPPAARSANVSPSSPMERNDFRKYVEWHIQYKQLNNRNIENFWIIYEILMNNDYDFQIIQIKKNSEYENWWKKQKIKIEIINQLTQNVNKYDQFKNKKKKNKLFYVIFIVGVEILFVFILKLKLKQFYFHCKSHIFNFQHIMK